MRAHLNFLSSRAQTRARFLSRRAFRAVARSHTAKALAFNSFEHIVRDLILFVSSNGARPERSLESVGSVRLSFYLSVRLNSLHELRPFARNGLHPSNGYVYMCFLDDESREGVCLFLDAG